MKLQNMKRSEDTEQMAVIQWVRSESRYHPELKLLHHCPNGGSRNAAEARKFKAMGVVAGVPDLHLPVPKGRYAGLYIEMKYDKGKLTNEQRDFISAAAYAGNYCVVCYSAFDAVKIIREYISLGVVEELDHVVDMHTPNRVIIKNGVIEPIY